MTLFSRRGFAATATRLSLPVVRAAQAAPGPADPDFAPLDRSANMPMIDAHSHYAGEHPAVLQWLADNNVKLLNVAVAGQNESWRAHAEVYRRLAKQHPDSYSWCTGFTLPDFATPGFSETAYAARAIQQLEKDFADGAVACKLWKSVGMRIQRPDGQFLQMDDPLFDPIYEWLASRKHTLLVHIADPMAAWLPLDENSTHHSYYRHHPEWHMYGRADHPHHSAIVAARDCVAARHPNLRIVGAHLGSLEYDLDELDKRLKEYPNLAVDTSGAARIGNLGQQDRDKVIAFMVKHQDRIMFGTDRSAQGQLTMAPAELARSLATLRTALQIGWDYYATDKTVMINGRPCQGLSLPEGVLYKLFCQNARQWYPGL